MIFSEIPHFIIKKFIERSYLLQSEDAYTYQEGEIVLNPDFIFKDRDNKHYWENTDNLTWSGIDVDTWINDSYLIGPRKSIVAFEEGIFLDLFYKDTEGFHPIRIKAYSNVNRDIYFNFEHIHNLNKPSDLYETVSEEHYDEEGDPYYSYVFNIYDIWDNRIEIENGTSLYFRKDSIFHTWLRNYASTILEEQHGIDFVINQYVNTNTPFIYLGDMYSKGNDEYHWVHYNINNFVMDAIPEHQRTDKLTEFIYLAFNIIYNNFYQLQKNFWNSIDPLECGRDAIEYLAEYHNIDLDSCYFSNISNKRWFVKNLTDILSTKGTYTGIYTLWKYITQSDNRLNIYERFHSRELSGSIGESDYYDWLHTSFYDSADFTSGAGEGWYKEYFDKPYPFYVETEKTENIISTFENPFSTKYIITQFYVNSDVIKPEKIYIDNSFIYHSTPESTKVTISEPDYIKRKEGVTWSVGHNLSSDALLIQFMDDDGYVFYPENIEIIDIDNIEVSFPESKEGYILLKKVGEIGVSVESESYISNNISDDFTVNHALGSENLIIEVFDSDFNKIVPDSITVTDSDNIQITLESSIETYTFIQQSEKTETISGTTEVDTRNLMLSTQYIIEPDLSTEPVEDEKILSKEAIETLFNFWEDFRPINRTSKYQILVSPITDFTGESMSLYDRELVPYLNTKSVITVGEMGSVEQGAFIDYAKNKKTYVVNHNLGSKNLLIDLYDKYMSKITFDEIEYIETTDENRIEIELSEANSFFVIIKKSENTYQKTSETESNKVTHPHNTISIITQSLVDSYIAEPESIQLSGNDTIYYDPSSIDNIYSYPSDFTSKEFNSTVWEVKHSLNSDAVIVDIYDENNYKIQPDELEIIDENNIKITFDNTTTGKCEIVSIGNVGVSVNTGCYISNNTSDDFTVNHGLGQNAIVQVYDSTFNRIKPKNVQIVDDNNVQITLEEVVETYTFIRGTTTDVSSYDWVLNSLEFGWDFYTKVNRFYEDLLVKIPDEVVINGTQQVLINGSNINRCVLHESDYEEEITVSSTEWVINHSLGGVGLIIDTYDENWEKIYPSSIQIDTSNKCTITFDESKQGHVLIVKAGNPSFNLVEDKFENSSLYVSSLENTLGSYDFYNPTSSLPTSAEDGDTYISSADGNGWEEYHIYQYNEDDSSWEEIVDNSDWLEVINIQKLRQDSDYIYTEFKLESSTEINIREMLIRGTESLVYTECSQMYKPTNCEMNIFFRLSKSTIER